jgi:hypothetical protein
MPFSGTLERSDVPEECIASTIRVKRISELGRTLGASWLNLFIMMMEAINSSQNVGSNKSHMASLLRRWHSSLSQLLVLRIAIKNILPLAEPPLGQNPAVCLRG